MDNYTILEEGKTYGTEDFKGFHKYRTGNDALFVYQFMTIWDWPEHKISHMTRLRGLYLDHVMTRLIAHRLGLCDDSLYKSYTSENFLVDITKDHDITVYDDESVYIYISFARNGYTDEDEFDRVNIKTKTFKGLDAQQSAVLKEITDKLSLNDFDLEKIADFAFSNMDDSSVVMDSIVKYGIENVSFSYLYDEYLNSTAK